MFDIRILVCVYCVAIACQHGGINAAEKFPPVDDDIERVDSNEKVDDLFLEEETSILPKPILSVAADDFPNEDIKREYENYKDGAPQPSKTEDAADKNSSGSKTPEEDAADDANSIVDPTKNDKDTAFLQPISLDFKGASLREVIRVLSAETHINFIIPDGLSSKKVYLSMKNVPWNEALEAILATNGLGIVKMKGDVVRIDAVDVLGKETESIEDIRKRAIGVTPTKVLVVRLSYAKAKDIVKIITNMLPSASFDKRVKVDSDDRTNSIVVEAIPQELSKIRSLIERIDSQTPQVRIESRVVEIIKSTNNFLGINWGGPLNLDQGRGLGFGNLVFPNNLISAFSVDSGAASNSNGEGKFDIHLGSLNNVAALDLRLRVGELTSQTRSLQNNSVLVVDGEKANIQAGTVDYFQVPIGNGQTSMSSVSYLLTLEVTPHITTDGAVQMVIKIENNSPTTPSSTAAASVSTRSLTTSMLRKTGETAVIGGLYTTSYEETKQGIPVLGDIPILGFLFSSTAKTESRRELIVLVTPTIVNARPLVVAQKDKAVNAGKDIILKDEKNDASDDDDSKNNANENNSNSNSNQNSNSNSNSKENQSLDQGNTK